MIKANLGQLVEMSVMGEVTHPRAKSGYRVSPDGQPAILPGVGGVTYNVRVGDAIAGWQADHVEPGVSIRNPDGDANTALQKMACLGNEATVVSGDAKGGRGVVTGKHGGVDHVILDFPERVLSQLAPGDRILVRAVGLGMELPDYPDTKVMNVSPRLLRRLGLAAARRKGRLSVGVSHVIPSALMGAGLGADNAESGDCDIQIPGGAAADEYGLATLRFGDVIAVTDADHTFGRVWRRGAVTVGVVVHSACTQAGHGPGLVSVLTSRQGRIETPVKSDANIGRLLGLGRFRRKRRAR